MAQAKGGHLVTVVLVVPDKMRVATAVIWASLLISVVHTSKPRSHFPLFPPPNPHRFVPAPREQRSKPPLMFRPSPPDTNPFTYTKLKAQIDSPTHHLQETTTHQTHDDFEDYSPAYQIDRPTPSQHITPSTLSIREHKSPKIRSENYFPPKGKIEFRLPKRVKKVRIPEKPYLVDASYKTIHKKPKPVKYEPEDTEETYHSPQISASGFFGSGGGGDEYGGGYEGHGGEHGHVEQGHEPGRILYHVSGHNGPHSYKFGYDTGKGKHRQFRFEERDNHGQVKGQYGFYDKQGKLQVVNYHAHPKGGFHAEGNFGKFPRSE